MDTKIKVLVRCRPLLAEEARQRRCLSITDDVIAVGDKRFQFERVLDESACQRDLYESSISSLVEGCFDGFNATVFAYGQTGSGKTHSIMGSSVDDDEEAGIIPRAINHIFAYLRSDKAAGRMASVRVSMVELYNDECKDLLHPEIPSRDIMIREDKHGRIFFTGAREEVVSSSKSALYYLEQGNLNRSTAETMMNQNSSRSHAIFTVSLEMLEYSEQDVIEEGVESALIQAKLHLVDLAGSERAKKTGASGMRFKESVGINQGLLSLGKVIRALTSNPVTHVPYRESKLTRFLQDSLGGNSRTLLLACVSPSDFNLHETINTLQYAQRAKSIHNKISANVSTAVTNPELQSELESHVVASLRAEIVRMQKEMVTLSQGQPSSGQLTANGILLAGDGSSGGAGDADQLRRLLGKFQHVTSTCKAALQQVLQETTNVNASFYEDFSSTVEEVSRLPLVHVSQHILSLLSDLLADGGSGNLGLLRSSLSESIANLRQYTAVQTGSNTGTNNEEQLQLMQEEMDNLKQELEECREDLKRDEDIFAEKMKELKKLKKQNKDLEVANADLRKTQEALRQQVLKIAKFPKMLLDEDSVSLTAKDDLDISIAVAMTEPDISQLLEDLETLTKEKEDLQQVEQIAKKQSEKIMYNYKKLKNKCHEQAEALNSRQTEIDTLKEEVLRLQEMAIKLERSEKEANNAMLPPPIPSVNNSHKEKEAMIAEKKYLQQIEDLETSLRRRKEAHFSDREELQRHISELEEEVQNWEEKYTDAVQSRDHSKLEIAQMQQALSKCQSELAVVQKERERAEQELKIQRANSAEPNVAISSSSTNTSEWSKQELEEITHCLESGMTNIIEAGVSQMEALRLTKALHVLNEEEEQLRKELQHQQSQLQLFVHQQTAATKQALLPIVSSNAIPDSPELKQCQEKLQQLDDKIRSCKLKATSVKMKLHSDPNNAKLQKDLEDIDFNVQTYLEHRHELFERLEKVKLEQNRIMERRLKEESESQAMLNKKSSDADRKKEEELKITVQDLQEDLDAIYTEITSTKQRLMQEKEKLKKSQFDSQATVSGDNHSNMSTFDRQVATLLHQVESFIHTRLQRKSFSFQQNMDQLQVFKAALQMLIKQRVKGGSVDQSYKQVKLQLDEKCSEYDNLVQTMQKLRNEHIRRQEQMRKESEDKITYLLQQLRHLEGRQTVAASASSTVANNSNSNNNPWNASRPPTAHSRPTSSSLSTSRRGEELSASGGLQRLYQSSQSKKTISDLLQQQLGQGNAQKGEEISKEVIPDLNQEVLQRWVAEKERREQLEKRNVELAKELRALRSNT